jgi:hypothetical protein
VSGTQLTQGESGFEARDVAVTTRTSVTTPALPPPETPKPEEPVLPVVTEPPAPEPEPSPPPQPGPQIFSHWAVSVGGGGWFSIPTDVTASLSLEVATLLLERVRLSLLFAGGSAMSRDLQSRGSLSAQAFVGLATATICAGQRFSGCGGLAAGAQLTTGAIASTPASGQHLYRPSDQLIALPVLGLHGRLALTIAGPVELALDLSALAPLGSGSFAIEGFTTPAYTTPPVELISGLRLGWTFY